MNLTWPDASPTSPWSRSPLLQSYASHLAGRLFLLSLEHASSPSPWSRSPLLQSYESHVDLTWPDASSPSPWSRSPLLQSYESHLAGRHFPPRRIPTWVRPGSDLGPAPVPVSRTSLASMQHAEPPGFRLF